MVLHVDFETIRAALQLLISLTSLALSILIFRLSRKTNVIVASEIVETLKQGLTDLEEKQQEIMFELRRSKEERETTN